jgi:hypothetical protein
MRVPVLQGARHQRARTVDIHSGFSTSVSLPAQAAIRCSMTMPMLILEFVSRAICGS